MAWGDFSGLFGGSPNWGGMASSLMGLLPSSSNPNWNWSTGLAGLSTLGGAATGAYSLAHQAALQRQLESFAKTPLPPVNVNQFYNPMSDAAMAALQRTGAANAMAQGLTPDQWQRVYGPELQAKTETERWGQAQQMAMQQQQINMQQRQQQINALMGRPPLPNIGDIGAFGNATMTNQLRQERMGLQQQNQANYNRMMDQLDPSRWGNWGSQSSVNTQNIPYYLQGQTQQPNMSWGMPNYGVGFPQTGTAPAQGAVGTTPSPSGIPGSESSAFEGQY